MSAPPSAKDVRELRRTLIECCLRLQRDGLVVGTAGNASLRFDDEHVVITPSGVDYQAMRPRDLPVVRLDGSRVLGDLKPTSEAAMHLALYRDPPTAAPVNAVVHTHAPASTAASALVDELPTIHYAMARCGGVVRVARYETFATPQLARAARQAMEGRTACLLANHGTLTVGSNLDAAIERTEIVEWTARVWLMAAAAGTPRLIDPPEFARICEKFETSYGQTPPVFATPPVPAVLPSSPDPSVPARS